MVSQRRQQTGMRTVSATTIGIPTATHARLQRIANEDGRPIGEVIDSLRDDYERQQFLAGLAEDFARLQADPEAWGDYRAESAASGVTLKDAPGDEPGEE